MATENKEREKGEANLPCREQINQIGATIGARGRREGIQRKSRRKKSVGEKIGR